MGYCKKCLGDMTNDCILTNGICVFCYYNIKIWNSNGQDITKRQAIRNQKQSFFIWHKYYIGYRKFLLRRSSKLPKGNIRRRKIKKYTYYYLTYRKGEKVLCDYIGKIVPQEFKDKIKLRRKIKKILHNLKPLFYALRIEKNFSRKKINRYEIFKRDNFTCQYCGKSVRQDKIKLHLDHKIPLSKGGLDNKKNYITSCDKCNVQKNSNI